MGEPQNDVPDPAAAHDVDAKAAGEVQGVPDYSEKGPDEDQRSEPTAKVDVDVNVEGEAPAQPETD